ncbi:MAG: type II toxin-antitoxin system PemK/MazF family toxin [Actinobacteria bacterium]|nr:type II toxin-antitoxin system PemK/MazF family toxin [Actinomycetota bacterium]
MVITRGRLYWADLGQPGGSRPAKHRPVLVIQAKPYNDSRLATAVVAAITSNTALAGMPGNVFLPATSTGLPKDSVVNVTALATVDKTDLQGTLGTLSVKLMNEVDEGIRRVLGL